MVATLIISANLANLGLLKIKVFLNKNYEVIIYVHDITSQMLSRDLSYIVDVIM